MYIINITTQVGIAEAEGWQAWMREAHIPEVMSTGLFTHHRMLRLLEVEETEGVTFAVQYFCNSLEAYERYKGLHAPSLHAKAAEKWGERVVSFRTLMEVIN